MAVDIQWIMVRTHNVKSVIWKREVVAWDVSSGGCKIPMGLWEEWQYRSDVWT